MDELKQFDVKASELLERRYSERFTALMRFQAERAHACYDEALALLDPADRHAQKPGLMMANIYRALLREIEADGFHVLHQRISLTPLRRWSRKPPRSGQRHPRRIERQRCVRCFLLRMTERMC
jgi:phytoene synthase